MQTQQKEDTANEKELFNNRYVRDKEGNITNISDSYIFTERIEYTH